MSVYPVNHGEGDRNSVASKSARGRHHALASAVLAISLGAGVLACQHGEHEHASQPIVARQQSTLTAQGQYVRFDEGEGGVALVAAGNATPLFVSEGDFPGVVRAAADLQADIERVTGVQPQLSQAAEATGTSLAVFIGTIGQSSWIDGLVGSGKLDVSEIEGRWEHFLIETVEQPMEGVERAVVIAGSDKRGTIYGIYDLSEKIGVSPWYDWADVPPQQHEELYLSPGRYVDGPKVKYRGFFINDENPALLDWHNETYGTQVRFGSQFYTRVFELLLRMKANYLWPAMWGKSFNDDDPDNPRLADEYGIVMGTSHHEPLTRSQQEWQDYGSGAWDYITNAEALREFWRGGMERSKDYEVLVTVGMRGDGDLPMNSDSIELMEQIVVDQRQILQEVLGRDPASVPQMWALYKEVQDFYDRGMSVPDDVTLLFADDNWGNIRRLPEASAEPRSGGYGIYYHFDYVGGPRSYKWINTNQISRVFEQMRLAYELDAKQVWLVNVGDIKPMEFPIHFFLDYAWDPEAWTAKRVGTYAERWAYTQFGEEHAEAIAHLLTEYSRFNSRRKPELLDANTYSLTNFREADRVVEEYQALVEQAKEVEAALPERYRDAFDQLVLFPVEASANLNEMYVALAKNGWYAQQGRATANEMADRVDELFDYDAELTERYHTLNGGKWNHMMKQPHIGYVDWDDPDTNVRPQTQRINVSDPASMGVSIEGSSQYWPAAGGQAVLPELSWYYPEEQRYVEVFSRGQTAFAYEVETEAAYLAISSTSGMVESQERIEIGVDWEQAPSGRNQVPVTIRGAGSEVVVQVALHKPEAPLPTEVTGFVQSAGYVAMEAAHYTNKVDGEGVAWEHVPDLGRTLSAMTPTPGNAPAQSAGDGPRLDYDVYLFDAGQVTVHAYLSPTLPVHRNGLRYAVAFDDAAPQAVNMHAGLPEAFDEGTPTWQEWVSNNVIVSSSTHMISEPGNHVLRLWMVDPGVVVQKLVIQVGGQLPTSYLGPPARGPIGDYPLASEPEDDWRADMLPSSPGEPGGGDTSGMGTGGDPTGDGAPTGVGGSGGGDTSSGGGVGAPPANGGGAAGSSGGAPAAAGGSAPVAGSAGAPPVAAGSGGMLGQGPETQAGDSGCSCRVVGREPRPGGAAWLLALPLVAALRRRRAR